MSKVSYLRGHFVGRGGANLVVFGAALFVVWGVHPAPVVALTIWPWVTIAAKEGAKGWRAALDLAVAGMTLSVLFALFFDDLGLAVVLLPALFVFMSGPMASAGRDTDLAGGEQSGSAKYLHLGRAIAHVFAANLFLEVLVSRPPAWEWMYPIVMLWGVSLALAREGVRGWTWAIDLACLGLVGAGILALWEFPPLTLVLPAMLLLIASVLAAYSFLHGGLDGADAPEWAGYVQPSTESAA